MPLWKLAHRCVAELTPNPSTSGGRRLMRPAAEAARKRIKTRCA